MALILMIKVFNMHLENKIIDNSFNSIVRDK